MDKQRIGILFLAVAAIFSSPLHPDMLWGPPSIVPNRYEGLFAQSKVLQGVRFTIRLNIVPKVQNAWRFMFTPTYTVKTWSLLKYRVYCI